MISAILLAAGQSKRMSGENKLTKKIQGIPLIKHSIKNILDSSVSELIIVLGYEKEIVQHFVDKNKKIKCVFNEDFEKGIASSIKVGLSHLSEKTDSFFISLADMPLVNKKIYNQLIQFKNDKEIIVPTYQGQQGNPILFNKSMKEKFTTIDGDVGAKMIINSNKEKILKININDNGIIVDFDTKQSFN